MEKLCIDVRGFSEEKKKRVQDAFFELGYGWFSVGKRHRHLNDSDDANYYISKYGDLVRDNETLLANTTYPDLMRKAGMDESDPDALPDFASKSPVYTSEISYTRDLQSVISDYLFLLDSIKDPYARGVIKSQITDLTDLQYQRFNGENNNA